MQALSKTDVEQDVMTMIPVGTPVFDKENRKIGDVERVQAASHSIDEPLTRPIGIMQAPEEVQLRLMKDGFVQIYAGLLWPDRYATPDQIAGITEEGLFLNVSREALLIL
jgi:hypothetical protein